MNNENVCKRLIREVDFFIKSNDVEYIFDNDWRTRFLVLFFPNIAKSLTWLSYSMETLKRTLEQAKNSQPDKKD